MWPCSRSRSSAWSTAPARAGPSRGSRRRSPRRTRAASCLISSNISSTPSTRNTSWACVVVGSVAHLRLRGDAPRRRSRRCTRRRSRPPGVGSPLRGGQQRPGEPVDLRAGVVEVVLRADLGAGWPAAAGRSASPTAAQRTPPMCTGPVGLAETNSRLICCPARVSLRPYAAPGLDDRAGQLPGGGGVEPDVEEARPGDLDRLDARRPAQLRRRAASASSRGGTPAAWPAAARALVA